MNGTIYTILAYAIGLGLLWGYAAALVMQLRKRCANGGQS
jgi:hypothetical protein